MNEQDSIKQGYDAWLDSKGGTGVNRRAVSEQQEPRRAWFVGDEKDGLPRMIRWPVVGPGGRFSLFDADEAQKLADLLTAKDEEIARLKAVNGPWHEYRYGETGHKIDVICCCTDGMHLGDGLDEGRLTAEYMNRLTAQAARGALLQVYADDAVADYRAEVAITGEGSHNGKRARYMAARYDALTSTPDATNKTEEAGS